MIERKTRPVSSPYEIWVTSNLSWAWAILKNWRKPENLGKSPYDRVFCAVSSPITRDQMSSDYEMGDVYYSEILKSAFLVWENGEWLKTPLVIDETQQTEILGWFGIKKRKKRK